MEFVYSFDYKKYKILNFHFLPLNPILVLFIKKKKTLLQVVVHQMKMENLLKIPTRTLMTLLLIQETLNLLKKVKLQKITNHLQMIILMKHLEKMVKILKKRKAHLQMIKKVVKKETLKTIKIQKKVKEVVKKEKALLTKMVKILILSLLIMKKVVKN